MLKHPAYPDTILFEHDVEKAIAAAEHLIEA